MIETTLKIVEAGLRRMTTDCGTVRFFSAPGRTELGGNHTDHQNGCVLAAAVTLDVIGAAALNNDNVVRVYSENYKPVIVELADLMPRAEEVGSSTALVRGVLEYLSRSMTLTGFDMFTQNDIPAGSGLSSSAAFEILVATAAAAMAGQSITPVEAAIAGRYAENVYFGKPSGLMDQLASASGGVVAIDFGAPGAPLVKKLDIDLNALGYVLCIIDTGAYHNELTDEYAAVPVEMKAVAELFGCKLLSEVDEDEFYAKLPALVGKVNDRALMRAMHFFDDTKRVRTEVQALENGDFGRFLELVSESGRSSWMLLQNVYPRGSTEQPAALALAYCAKLLGGCGAYRIHGGGFAGTIQAVVPTDMLDEFKDGIERLCGTGSCRVLDIRAEGSVEIKI